MLLHEAFKAALPHVSLPKYGITRLEHLLLTPEGVLYASDRYSLVRIEISELPLPEEQVLIPAAIAKQVKTKKVVAVTASSVTLFDGTVLGWTPYTDDFFPNLEMLISKERAVLPIDKFKLNWDYVARFADKHLPKHLKESLVCTPLEGNMYRFDSPTGEFTGLLCGIRL